MNYKLFKTLPLSTIAFLTASHAIAFDIEPTHVPTHNSYNQPVYVAPIQITSERTNGYAVSDEEFYEYRSKALAKSQAAARAKENAIEDAYAKQLELAQEQLKAYKQKLDMASANQLIANKKNLPEEIRFKAKIAQIEAEKKSALLKAKEQAKAEQEAILKELADAKAEQETIRSELQIEKQQAISAAIAKAESDKKEALRKMEEEKQKAIAKTSNKKDMELLEAIAKADDEKARLLEEIKEREASTKKLLGLSEQSITEQVECNFPDKNTRYYEKNGGYYFLSKKGKLEDNLKELIKHTHPQYTYVFELSRHNVFSDSCIFALSEQRLIQKMIEAYEEPSKIYFGTFPNGVASFFYENSETFSKYVRYIK